VVKHAIDNEDFLFADAQQIVVVRTAANDRLSRSIEIGRFINDDRWIARAGDDRALAAVEGRSSDRGAAGDAYQVDQAVFENRVGRFERRFGNQTDQVVDSELSVNRFIESPY